MDFFYDSYVEMRYLVINFLLINIGYKVNFVDIYSSVSVIKYNVLIIC